MITTEQKLKRWIVLLAFLLGIMSTLSIFNPIVRRSLLEYGALSESYYISAEMSVMEGDRLKAKYEYEFALWCNPYHKEAKQALQKLNN